MPDATERKQLGLRSSETTPTKSNLQALRHSFNSGKVLTSTPEHLDDHHAPTVLHVFPKPPQTYYKPQKRMVRSPDPFDPLEDVWNLHDYISHSRLATEMTYIMRKTSLAIIPIMPPTILIQDIALGNARDYYQQLCTLRLHCSSLFRLTLKDPTYDPHKNGTAKGA